MKLKVSNTNTPNWRMMTVSAEIPAELKPLEVMSKNLWWVWNSKGKSLFRDLDHDLWRAVGENPVMLLQQLSYERYNEILNDKALRERIDDTYREFNDYMSQPIDKKIPAVSYFSMEYGLCNCLKIYSGGLGVLAGDYIKQASDSRVDMTAVGFLYKYGYFSQSLAMDGQQIANYESQNFDQLPIDPVLDENGQPMILEVPFPGRIIYCHVWRVNVGRMKLYLLDTDLDKNSEWDRPITHKLYGGGVSARYRRYHNARQARHPHTAVSLQRGSRRPAQPAASGELRAARRTVVQRGSGAGARIVALYRPHPRARGSRLLRRVAVRQILR